MADKPHGHGRTPTIYDVARAAGVAASTVSRAFSRPGRVHVETAERIRRVAADLGYHAHPITRMPSAARTSMVALVVSDITNPFAGEIIRGAHVAAAQAGYCVLLAEAQESGEREREVLERAMSAVDGVVLATSRMPDDTIRVMAKCRPLVVLNRAIAGVPCITTDNPGGMRRAVEHLAALGHRRITYVPGPEASRADATRWWTLRTAAAETGLRVRRIGPRVPTISGGAAAAADLLRHPTSAVIAYNDLMAIGLIQALAAYGVDVPREVSVVGFDNVYAAELVTPALTTVAAPLTAMGLTAVRNLLALVRGAQPRAADPMVLPSRLVVRASTTRPNRYGTAPTPASLMTASGSR